MICAVCRRRVREDPPLGYVHDDDSTLMAEDGHRVVGVRDPRE